MKITLQDIIEQVAEQTGSTKKLSEDFLRELLNIIEETLNKEGIVKIKGFGTFKLLLVEERKSVNVQTGEEIAIPQHNKISFIPEKELKAAINKPYSHLETYILSKDGPVDLPENENEEEDNEVPVIVDNEASAIINEVSITIDDEVPETVDNEVSVTIDEEKPEPEITIIPVQEEEKEENTDKIKTDTPTKNKGKKKRKSKSNIGEKSKSTKEKKEKKKSSKWAIILFILIILGLIALLIWWMDGSKFSPVKEGTNTEEVQPAPEDEISEDKIMNEEQLSDNKTNEILKSEPNHSDQAYGSTTPNPNRAPEFPGEYLFDKKFDFKLVDYMQANYPNMKLITYGTPQETVLKEGSRLTLISRDYYGDKKFWVYIYLYNTDIIKDPSNIPTGTIIKVPKLDKSLVDPNNQATIDAAWNVQKYLLKM